jgi:uncharacterized membrane protein YeaQ/YmgE (transglycosylase-associated protein family)
VGGVVSWIIWGLFIGMIARLLVPGRQGIGIVWTILLGVAGSVLGGLLATKVLNIGETGSFDFGSFVIAVLVSTLLLGVGERVNRALPDRTRRDQPDPRGRY